MLVENELDRLKDLLYSHNVSGELLLKYLEFYKHAVEQNLDHRGQPVIDWLNNVVSTS